MLWRANPLRFYREQVAIIPFRQIWSFYKLLIKTFLINLSSVVFLAGDVATIPTISITIYMYIKQKLDEKFSRVK